MARKLREPPWCQCGALMRWSQHWKLYTCAACGRCYSARIARQRQLEAGLLELADGADFPPGPAPLVIWSGWKP